MNMNARAPIAIAITLALIAAGCKKEEKQGAEASNAQAAPAPGPAEKSTATTTPTPTTTTPAAPAARQTGDSTAQSAPQGGAAAGSTAAIASQETNWPGVTADVTEFRRKGNTLTAKVRLRNQGSKEVEPQIHFNETYVMDAAAGKKYEVLKDEKDAYIASLRSGWKDQWSQRIAPGESQSIWMKFPAPPPDVKSVTLQVPGMAPFEDLSIQDQ
jgi:hypothetical protein